MKLWVLITRYPRATTLTVIGAGMLIAGFILDGGGRQAVASLLTQLGSAIPLVAAVVLLERKIMIEVSREATAIARDSAREAIERGSELAADELHQLRERVERLEGVDKIQYQQLYERSLESDLIVKGFEEDPSFPNTLRLLLDAQNYNYFASDFAVRYGSNATGGLLYMRAQADEPAIRFSFDSPVSDESDLMWTSDQSLDDAFRAISGESERSNVGEFSLSDCLYSLARSHRAMRQARAVSRDDSRRLQGKLHLLINLSWALSTSGLEHRRYNICVPIRVEHREKRLSVPNWYFVIWGPRLSLAIRWSNRFESFHVTPRTPWLEVVRKAMLLAFVAACLGLFLYSSCTKGSPFSIDGSEQVPEVAAGRWPFADDNDVITEWAEECTRS